MRNLDGPDADSIGQQHITLSYCIAAALGIKSEESFNFHALYSIEKCHPTFLKSDYEKIVERILSLFGPS